VEAPATSDAVPSSGKKSKTHPPKPYDIVQGMQRVIDMMEETLQICERAQRSTQDASQRRTFPFDLWPPSDVYTRQAAKSIQIQFGRHQTIWRPQGRTSRTSRPSRRTVYLPQGRTTHTPWLPATEEDRSGARRRARHTGSHVSGRW
jgi:hypothetical protein